MFLFCQKKIEIKPDLKICCFAVTRPSLQKAGGSKKILTLIREKNFFSHKYIIFLAMLTLESEVNFLFFLLSHFLVVRVVSYPLPSAQVSLDRAILVRQLGVNSASRNFGNTFSPHTKRLRDIKCSVSFMFYKVA